MLTNYFVSVFQKIKLETTIDYYNSILLNNFLNKYLLEVM